MQWSFSPDIRCITNSHQGVSMCETVHGIHLVKNPLKKYLYINIIKQLHDYICTSEEPTTTSCGTHVRIHLNQQIIIHLSFRNKVYFFKSKAIVFLIFRFMGPYGQDSAHFTIKTSLYKSLSTPARI